MKLLTPEEATAAFVTMNERFQSAMKEFENNKVSFEALIKEFTLMKEKLESLSKEHFSLKQASSAAVNALDSKSSGLYTNLSSSVSTVSKVVDSFSKEAEYIKKEIQNLKNGMKKANENHADLLKNSSSNIVNLSTEIEDVKTTLINFASKFEDADKSGKGAHADLKNFVTILANDLITAKGNLREFVGATSGFQKDLSSHKEAIASRMEQLNHTMMCYVDDKISALPKPSTAVPITQEDAKAIVQKQVEPASFDAKNANLRSSNNEQKIVLLEKKVENLQLLLNKLQLAH
jgi:methyl-accepting chemotaxis protein